MNRYVYVGRRGAARGILNGLPLSAACWALLYLAYRLATGGE